MTGRAVVLRGDAAHLPLPDGSVDLIVTSPPYWQLRSYTDSGQHYEGQIGSEETPAEYIRALIRCTAEWVRVLKPSGSIFVVLGDKYSDRGHGPNRGNGTGRGPQAVSLSQTRGPLEKSLLLLPERYRIACVDDLGLIARAVIEWDKNAIPESVTDRVRRSHEDVVHLTRQPRYFAAVDEIREPHAMRPQRRPNGHKQRHALGILPAQTYSTSQRDEMGVDGHPLGRLPGSVWDIPTSPLFVPESLGISHFAAYPPELVRRIVLGWSPSGYCLECGEARRPVPASLVLDLSRPQARRAQQLADLAGLTEDHLNALLSVGISDTGRGAATQNGTGRNSAEVYELAAEARAALGGYAREYLLRRPARLAYACACPDSSAPTRPAVILDPCGGTGTSALVAAVLGRIGVTVDRSADYCRLATWRVNDPAERAKAMQVPKPPPVPRDHPTLFDVS